MAKIPVTGKTITRTPAKPAGGGAKGMNLPPGVKAEVRKIVREEIKKTRG